MSERRRPACLSAKREKVSRTFGARAGEPPALPIKNTQMVAIIHKRSWRDFDWILALLAIGIVLFGTIQIRNAQPAESYWVKQLIGLSIGLVAMLAIAFTDYRKLLNLAPAFYVFGLILLVIVLVPGIGLKINGQRAWIKVPAIGQFQPSEFVKVTTAMMLARYFGKNRVQVLTVKEMIVGGLILALPIGLILLEPDVGSVLTYMPILAVVLFLSAIRLRLVVAATVLAVILIPFAYVMGVKTGMVKGYQQERINVILDPENADRRRIGYHTWQSIITVGEGGLFGSRSSAEHSQSGLKFLPEPHTDFIYAVTAENAGFVGCVLVLLAYIVLLSRLITGARRAADRMGMLFIMAFVGGLTFQIFINIGMALGISPVIGVPLPLMSAGLASLIATFIAIGFAISVQLRRFVN
jgi:rod shape determining protein RodA